MPTKRLTYCLFFLFLSLTGIGVTLSAQNNPYKIADSLYPFYQRATRMRSRPESLLSADTLYHQAVRLGDKKAQCLARTIPVQYYTDHKDEQALRRAVEDLKTLSRTNGYLQYYYHGWNNLIVYLLNSEHSLTALKEAEEMKLQAFEDHNDYGIYTCINSIANIYQARDNNKMATGYREELLKFMLEKLPEQDPTLLYLKIAAYYRTDSQDSSKAQEYIGKAVRSAKTESIRIRVLEEECMYSYAQKRHDDFNRYYDRLMKAFDGQTVDPIYLNILIYKKVLDGDYDEAHTLANDVSNIAQRWALHVLIYEAEGDYQAANAGRKAMAEEAKERIAQLQSTDIAELNAQIGNERLKLENARLDLKNSDLRLAQVRQQMELERRNAENNQLMLDNRELEVQRLTAQTKLQQAETERQRAEAERQKALLEQQRTSSHYQIILLGIIIAFLILIQLRRRHNMMRLRKKNEELAVARDEAQSANRMKSMFIQNMSHEIRTPLNSIVGFSQLIANPEMELEPEEQQEYSELIVSNSELLTTLVNDLLSLAELESGKYVTKMAPQRCNDLCRQSLATVTHRKPQDVRLYYTSDVPDDYEITTDGQRVRQVLINLLTNAEKHTEHGEIHLHCSLSETPGSATFSVTDTGTGIPAEQAEHIFERFEKLNAFDQGFGLGLSICRLIADYLGAVVKLDTSYKDGARFLFILPG
ncbi:sensor histidine kinase KdpD [Bacteroides helcogenes]|uniref:histidine kinase n=1 Tax=Bacteroides helcogenes (strain ATCC 35417 / DSM 20613 / JCM 6297 / CCUG 15421 / P 36-108) TaxID=693979 RepID=E6SWL7_BACT6|nr:ATP-binding protein [Bacteroides helcogenes]ADV42615.1 integral membrane sensor signal transduction histidine kinase [Bacteroides helcogenes P 36-108]MDY5237623.1 ATP-binding protein [Bacteroides helcogenes]